MLKWVIRLTATVRQLADRWSAINQLDLLELGLASHREWLTAEVQRLGNQGAMMMEQMKVPQF